MSGRCSLVALQPFIQLCTIEVQAFSLRTEVRDGLVTGKLIQMAFAETQILASLGKVQDIFFEKILLDDQLFYAFELFDNRIIVTHFLFRLKDSQLVCVPFKQRKQGTFPAV